MLRLRFGELAHDLRLQGLTLWATSPLDWSAASWLPATDAPTSAQFPLFRIDGSPRPESVLLTRDALREREPAALVVVGTDVGRIPAALREIGSDAPRTASIWAWMMVIAVALAMVATLRRTAVSGRTGTVLRAVVALVLPIWLVVGLQLGDDIDGPAAAAVAVVLLYAILLTWLDTTTPWRWFGGLRAWLAAAAAPLLALAAVLILGHPGSYGTITVASLVSYALWALLQQYLICVVFADRLDRAGLPARWTVLVSAGVFALLHAPNAALMLATFCGGLIWSALWLRERSLAPIALSHAAAALLLGSGLPPAVLRSAEVSLRYYL